MKENPSVPVNKRALFVYLLLAIGWTWALWIPPLLWARQGNYLLPRIASFMTETPFSIIDGQHLLLSLMFSLAVYGPLIGGFVATYMTEGKVGVQRLLGQMTRWRVGGRWYGTAVFIVLLITIIPLAIGLLAGLTGLLTTGVPFTIVTFLVLMIHQTLTSGLGEEPGWRGYLLPALQASYSQTKAIWLMGIIWAIWHFPFTISVALASFDPALGAPITAVIGVALLGQIMTLVGIAYLYTWLLNQTDSLFLLILFHAFSNVVPELALRTFAPHMLVSLLLGLSPWIVVILLEKRLGKENFPGRVAKHVA